MTYSGGSSLLQPADVDAAVMDWNNAQGRVPLTAQVGAPNDLQISDKPLGQYTYGLTTVFGQICDPNCFNKIMDCNGACLNSSAIYYVTVNLDTTEITNEANALSMAGLSTSPAAGAAYTLRPELGNALSLAHPLVLTEICSATQDVMMSGSVGIVCGVTAPTSCDTTVMNNVYSSSPGYCSPSDTASCSGTCS